MRFKGLKVGDRFRWTIDHLSKRKWLKISYRKAEDLENGECWNFAARERVVRLVPKKKPATEAPTQYRDLTEAELKCLPKEAEFHVVDDEWERTTRAGRCFQRGIDLSRYRMPASIPPPAEQPKTETCQWHRGDPDLCQRWKERLEQLHEQPILVRFDSLKPGDWFLESGENYMVVGIEHRNGCVSPRGVIHWFGPQYSVQPLSKAEVAAWLLKEDAK